MCTALMRMAASASAAEGINFPNGLAFSPDESILYIVESRASPRTILAYDVVGGTTVGRAAHCHRRRPGHARRF